MSQEEDDLRKIEAAKFRASLLDAKPNTKETKIVYVYNEGHYRPGHEGNQQWQ